MARLTMTDFIDVVSKSGTPKATKVKQVKNRPEYHPSTDYYKQVREELVNCHKKGDGKDRIREFIEKVANKKKVVHYKEVVEGYCNWWGKKSLKWFTPPGELFASSGVEVMVNPELGLELDGARHIIKLYFKEEPLSKFRIDIATHLMETVLRKKAKSNDKMAVLDVRNAKLIHTGDPKGLSPILQAEMAYIAALWPNV